MVWSVSTHVLAALVLATSLTLAAGATDYGEMQSMRVHGSYLYVLHKRALLMYSTERNDTNPVEVSIAGAGDMSDFIVVVNTVYIASASGLVLVDVIIPDQPMVLGTYNSSDPVVKVDVEKLGDMVVMIMLNDKDYVCLVTSNDHYGSIPSAKWAHYDQATSIALRSRLTFVGGDGVIWVVGTDARGLGWTIAVHRDPTLGVLSTCERRGDVLYFGGSRGVFVFNISNAFTIPPSVSEIRRLEFMDSNHPVVQLRVWGQKTYVGRKLVGVLELDEELNTTARHYLRPVLGLAVSPQAVYVGTEGGEVKKWPVADVPTPPPSPTPPLFPGFLDFVGMAAYGGYVYRVHKIGVHIYRDNGLDKTHVKSIKILTKCCIRCFYLNPVLKKLYLGQGGGFSVYDLENDPLTLPEIHGVPNFGSNDIAASDDGTVLALRSQGNLYVERTSPQGVFDIPDTSRLTVWGHTVYTVGRKGKVGVIELGADQPRVVATHQLPDTDSNFDPEIVTDGKVVYIGGSGRVDAYHISEGNLTMLGRCAVSNYRVTHMQLWNELLFVDTWGVGVVVVSIADPSNMVVVKSEEYPHLMHTLTTSNGTYAALDIPYGAFEMIAAPLPQTAVQDMAMRGDLLYTHVEGGLRILNTSGGLRELGTLQLARHNTLGPMAVGWAGDRAYLVRGDRTLAVDVSNASSPRLVSDDEYAIPSGVDLLALEEGLYVAEQRGTVRLIPTTAAGAGAREVGVGCGALGSLARHGDVIYVGGTGKLCIVDRRTLKVLKEIKDDAFGEVRSAMVVGEALYVGGSSGLFGFNLSNPLAPVKTASVATGHAVVDMAGWSNVALYVVLDGKGLSIYDIMEEAGALVLKSTRPLRNITSVAVGGDGVFVGNLEGLWEWGPPLYIVSPSPGVQGGLTRSHGAMQRSNITALVLLWVSGAFWMLVAVPAVAFYTRRQLRRCCHSAPKSETPYLPDVAPLALRASTPTDHPVSAPDFAVQYNVGNPNSLDQEFHDYSAYTTYLPSELNAQSDCNYTAY